VQICPLRGGDRDSTVPLRRGSAPDRANLGSTAAVVQRNAMARLQTYMAGNLVELSPF
jgi:hypothetical protein